MSEFNQVPAYLTPAEIAEACGMTTKAARGKLRRAGILEQDGERAYHVGESRLRERLPDMYDRVYAWFVLRAPERPRETGNARDVP